LQRIGDFPEWMYETLHLVRNDIITPAREREARSPVNNRGHQAVNGTGQSQSKQCWSVSVVAQSDISSQGMSAILSRDSRFRLCGAVHEDEGAEEIVESHRPDLVLIEPVVESVNGFRLVGHIAARSPDIKILVISERAESVYAERALRAGASGYFVKTGSVDAFLQAIETILSVSPGLSKVGSPKLPQLIDRRTIASSALRSLSERELEVLSLIAAGHGVGRIAEELGISRKTIETHCEHIKIKLAYRDAKELKVGARRLLGS
jgi:DNA-binding NarL/FixJ family response regulator